MVEGLLAGRQLGAAEEGQWKVGSSRVVGLGREGWQAAAGEEVGAILGKEERKWKQAKGGKVREWGQQIAGC